MDALEKNKSETGGVITMKNIFVYGTLRKGESNHSYLKDAVIICDQAWIYGELFETGYGYPVLKESNKEQVYGEIYAVTDEQLGEINRLEGYQENANDNLYERITVDAHNEKGNIIKTLTYITGKSLASASQIIRFGDWKVYQYLKREDILYFAYGSCMDNERFKLANVDQYFTQIKGRGILNGYGLRFSISTTDGGKADIRKSPADAVEGVVYEIPDDAVEYLFEREGVYIKGYRPAIVSLRIENKETEVLSFVGVIKNDETPPTDRYATEIIRGATGILSDAYVSQLEQYMNKMKK